MASAERWPTAVDYQVAFQTPHLCFNDAVLRRGKVVADALGLPLAVSGNVVTVFRMTLEQGEAAIRCFTRQSTSSVLQHRYEALQAHFGRHHLPAFAASLYRPDEMLVAGRRYPIVQMEWIRGAQLHRFVEQNLDEEAVLHGLADQWRILMACLATARIAHGDLSDGNILVDEQGRLRLVDYDAAYVPALKAEPPNELGKPDYQHPERLTQDSSWYGYYAENMDAFSALVIYLSLRALADDPSRWGRYHTGENLIFTRGDYGHPGFTPIWQDLRGSEDAEVCALTKVLERYCRASVADLPHLEEVLRGGAPRRLLSRIAGATEAEEAVSAAPPEPARRQDRPPEPPPVRPDSEAPEVRKARWPRLTAAGLGMVVVMAAVAGIWRKPDAPVLERTVAPPHAAMGTLTPQDLAGFYTGYATSEDGTREAMALTIDPPDTSYVGDDARLSYSINWKSRQSGGFGYYNRKTGHLDLENLYELYVAYADGDEVVLASLAREKQGPLVKVNKRKSL